MDRSTRSSQPTGREPYRQFIIYDHYVEFKFLLVSKDFHRHSSTSDNIGNQMHAAAFTEIGNKMTIKYILFM